MDDLSAALDYMTRTTKPGASPKPVRPMPSAVVAGPDADAFENAYASNPSIEAEFQQALAKADPATRADLLHSRMMVQPQQADPMSDALSYLDKPAPAAAPASQAQSQSPLQVAASRATRSAVDALTGPARFVGHQISSLGAQIVGGYHGIGTLIGHLASGSSLSDAAFNSATDVEEQIRNRTLLTPSPGTTADALNSAYGSNYNPLTWAPKASDWAGSKTAEMTGSPALGAAVNVAGNVVLPTVAGKAAKAVIPKIRQSVGAPEAAPAVAPPAAPALENNPSPTLEGLPAAESVKVGAASSKPAFSEPSKGVFAEAAPDAPGGVPMSEQARRAQVLNEIGLNGNIRRSAITGNSSEAATDFQTSRLNSPAGQAMRSVLENEKATIGQYAEKIAQDTGGSALNDQSAKYARGGAIVAPLEGLKDWFDTQISSLYKTADERAQGVPTTLDRFRTVLGDDSELTNSDRVHLQTAVNAYAKKLGLVGDDGSVFATAQQAETMRKYLNENWSPQTSKWVGKLKDALDEDVTSSAGEDIYSEARRMRSLRGQTIDDPTGIAKLLDSSGPNGINRAVATEKIPDTVTNMPVDQLKHVVDTLNSVPQELQPQAQAALSEIKAQFAHNVHDIGAKQAGQWNAKGVRQYLTNNSQRMAVVFSPEELQRFGTLNDAGNILAKDQSYPGAHAQEQNLVRAGVSGAIQHGATAAGAAVGGPMGAMVGNVVGGKIAGKIDTAAEMRAFNKRVTPLKELLPSGLPPGKTGPPGP